MKTTRIVGPILCVLLLAGAASAQIVTVRHTMDYHDNHEPFVEGSIGPFFIDPRLGPILDSSPWFRHMSQDWGWLHDIAGHVPLDATGIESAKLEIIAWGVAPPAYLDWGAPEFGGPRWVAEEHMIYVHPLPHRSQLGLLKTYMESPIQVTWPYKEHEGHTQRAGYEDYFSITTFDLAHVIDHLWTTEQIEVFMDIDQMPDFEAGKRVTLISATLEIRYFVSGEITPPTPKPPVLADNFDDNQKGALWITYGMTDEARATEINNRLEFTTDPVVSASFGYISDQWAIDSSEDFRMELNLHFGAISDGDGWISFGLTPDASGPDSRYIRFGIGASQGFQNYWLEQKDGQKIHPSFKERTDQDVTLYLSYEAATDVLYVSYIGYGPELDLKAIPGPIPDQWSGAPLYVFIGATTEKMALYSGEAYVNKFVIEQGTILDVSDGTPKPPDPKDPSDPEDPSDPKDPDQPGTEPSPDVAARIWILPSQISRTGSGNIKVIVSLPRSIRMTQWDSMDEPVITRGNTDIKVSNMQAAVWPGGTLIIVGSFSRDELMQAVSDDGPVELHLTGRLRDGRSYGGSDVIVIE